MTLRVWFYEDFKQDPHYCVELVPGKADNSELVIEDLSYVISDAIGAFFEEHGPHVVALRERHFTGGRAVAGAGARRQRAGSWRGS